MTPADVFMMAFVLQAAAAPRRRWLAWLRRKMSNLIFSEVQL